MGTRVHRLLGLCTVTIGLAEVSRFLATLPFGASGSAFVVQSDGTLIATSVSDPTRAQYLSNIVIEQLREANVLTPPIRNPYRVPASNPFVLRVPVSIDSS